MKSVRLTAALVLFVSSAFAQSMTSISPNYGPGNSTVTITGTGFSMTPKSTRFVDNGNMDIFYPISCTSTTTCFGTPRTGLVTSGSQNLAVFALVDGSKSGSFASFRYYAPPVVSSLVPATVPFNTGGQTVNVNGGIFTSGVSFPGTTSIYMYTSTNDYTNGCGSTALCSFFAPAICGDFSQGGGAMLVAVSTPGGTTNPYSSTVQRLPRQRSPRSVRVPDLLVEETQSRSPAQIFVQERLRRCSPLRTLPAAALATPA